jgi:hypothetical protein
VIYHVSIPARNTERVARVMGELLAGPVMQFVSAPGCFVIFCADGDGGSIEVVPVELRHLPGESAGEGVSYGIDHGPDQTGTRFSAVRVALSSALPSEQIIAIGRREGWRALRGSRTASFAAVELWIENRVLLEIVCAKWLQTCPNA